MAMWLQHQEAIDLCMVYLQWCTFGSSVAFHFSMVIKNEGMKSEENIKNGAGLGCRQQRKD